MLKDIILDRRSIRKYEDKKIDKELIEEILMYSLMGPSYGNARPIEFIVVEDKETLNKLAGIETFGTKYIKDAPTVIIIIANTEISTTWVEEGSIAASYLQLLAQENGLSTSWINLKDGTTSDDEDIQEFTHKLFKLPEKFKTLCMIPVGYGKEKVRKRDEFDISTKVHYEKM